MMNWTEVETVLLDMDGTLLDLHFDNYFWLKHLPQRYAEHHGLPYATALKAITEISNASQGSLNWYCLDYWTEQTALNILALKEEVASRISLRRGTNQFLCFLRKKGLRIFIVTNAHPQSLALKCTYSGIHELVDLQFSSHHFNLAKENPGFWRLFQKTFKLDYARCIFIDDNLAVLRNAAKEGLKNLIQVTLPDSRGPENVCAEFPSVRYLDELLK